MNFKFEYSTNADLEGERFSLNSLNESLEDFNKTISSKENGFYNLTDDQNLVSTTKEVFEKIKYKKHFVQIGIGGSALGPQMLVSSLKRNWDKTFTALDNTDSDYIHDELMQISLKDSIFYVVSKSGGTAETIATYCIVRNLLLESGIKKDDLSKYFIFCTDIESGQLREHVNKNKYTSLIVPSNVGGRFSVLSHVGLLPALFMGIDIQKLLDGANSIKKSITSNEFKDNNLLQTAAHLISLYNDEGVNETVLMPYSSKLKDLSYWFVQLWGESLGKFSKKLNKNVGLTPIPAYGATDQHSQMQLFMEGPNNKLIFLIEILNKKNNFSLDSDLDLDSSNKLSPFSMNQLLEAELQGTKSALKEKSRNFIGISIDTLDEYSMGQLILYFECLTAVMGNHLLIDPFNQPGVELGKIYAFEYLNSLSLSSDK